MLEEKREFAKHPNLVPDLQWKEWTHKHLASSDVCWISDLDSVIRTRKGCIIIVEIKRKNADVPYWQQITYGMIAAALKYAEGQELSHPSLPSFMNGVTLTKFEGVAEIIFENTSFEDGVVWFSLNGEKHRQITEAELINILSFSDDCELCLDEEHCK